jgi:hypothetical protein
LVIPAVCAGGACEAGLVLIGGGGWLAANRPQNMSRIEERHFDRSCTNTDDPCRNLKENVRRAIAEAKNKMDAMERDPSKLYQFAREVPNPAMTNSPTTWNNHAKDLDGRINNIWAMISLEPVMNCSRVNY